VAVVSGSMLTIDDVLAIRHPEPPRWSPAGNRVAFAYLADGRRELWSAPPHGGQPARVSQPEQSIGPWDWSPEGGLTYAVDGTVWHEGAAEPLLRGTAAVAELKWSPDGRTLGVLRQGRLLLLGQGPTLREPVLPGTVTPTFAWSPSGRRLACAILEDGRRDLAVLDVAGGEVIWRSRTPEMETGAAWVGDERLCLVRASLDATRRDYLLVEPGSGREELLERVVSPKGLSVLVPPVAAPDGRAVALTVPVDGWLHLVIHDLARGTRTLALPGEHEDLGTETERPCFAPDSRFLAFASSRGALQQRQLWRYDRAGGEVRRLTDRPGTYTDPAWSPDGRLLACLHCGPDHSPEVAVVPAEGGETRLLTRSMPPAWTPAAIVLPQHVVLESRDGFRPHADLFLPPTIPDGARLPGLVFVHGGPSRQMRYGWHPMHSYAVFYAFNQFLVQRGFAVISVDYRGGTGYGVDYEQANHLQFGQGDLDDCVAAAEHLASLPCVDPTRIGIWGLSYGGYMTLCALTKRPEVFAMGINIAGIWDFEQWARWVEEQNPGTPNYFVRRWGGPPGEHNAEAYRQMSPKNFVAGLRAPLLNLQGTADANVDFAQLDRLVADCTEHGKDFAAHYYPGESHMFTRRTTWADAFRRMVAAFDRYLRCDPAARPPAMI
jgi:dipeptidyl aminopeptidase/acylaminoacyl peptidase